MQICGTVSAQEKTMGARAYCVVVTIAGLVGGFSANADAASDRTPSRNQSQRLSLVGCLAQTPDGAFELSDATPASMARRSGGSNSAKASTPIGNLSVSDRPRTAGAITPKGSTPISVAPVRFASRATNGANSPKASTPVRRTVTSAYALDGQRSDVEPYAGRRVEVSGAQRQQYVLTVETIRVLAASCAE
jgi:hypothetical protein